MVELEQQVAELEQLQMEAGCWGWCSQLGTDNLDPGKKLKSKSFR